MNPKKQFKFNVFEDKSSRPGDVPRATISKSGNINFNKKFREENWPNLEGYYVIFQYDRENQVIGLQIVMDPAHNSYPIRELPDGNGLVVSARAFLKHNSIPFRKSTSYKIELYREDDGYPFFIIDLTQKNKA